MHTLLAKLIILQFQQKMKDVGFEVFTAVVLATCLLAGSC
jgi:hypothetical protein